MQTRFLSVMDILFDVFRALNLFFDSIFTLRKMLHGAVWLPRGWLLLSCNGKMGKNNFKKVEKSNFVYFLSM